MFVGFEHRVADAPIELRMVPRPPAHDVIGASAATTAAAWRKCCQRQLLRWHPDKWASRCMAESDAQEIQQLAAAMTRAVLREKERGYRGRE